MFQNERIMGILDVLLIIHVITGLVALTSSPVALFTPKANWLHRVAGKIFVVAMTFVFVTAVILSSVKSIPFLFMLSFLSYYSVFAGVRILKLKNLTSDQRPKWYDWLANGLTLIAGVSFVFWGSYHWFYNGLQVVVILAIIFGAVTIRVAYIDVAPFIWKPKEKQFWWFYHMGNMLGGTAAAFTAFLTTIESRMEWDAPFVWVIPLILLGITSPILDRYYTKKFGIVKKR